MEDKPAQKLYSSAQSQTSGHPSVNIKFCYELQEKTLLLIDLNVIFLF